MVSFLISTTRNILVPRNRKQVNDYWSFASKHFVMRSMPRCMWKFLYHTGCHVFVVAFFGGGRGALDALYVLLKRRVYAMLGLGGSAQGVVCLAGGVCSPVPPGQNDRHV